MPPQTDQVTQAAGHLFRAAELKAEAQQKLDEAKALMREAQDLGPAAGPPVLERAVVALGHSRRLRAEGENHLRVALAITLEGTD